MKWFLKGLPTCAVDHLHPNRLAPPLPQPLYLDSLFVYAPETASESVKRIFLRNSTERGRSTLLYYK